MLHYRTAKNLNTRSPRRRHALRQYHFWHRRVCDLRPEGGLVGFLPFRRSAYIFLQTYWRSENKDKVEMYLAFGASRFEACKPIARDALRLALTPNINQMRSVPPFHCFSKRTY